jgi:hypothetical protein
MATIDLEMLASNGSYNTSREVFATMSATNAGAPMAAPLVYVDSGSALGTLSAFPTSTAVSLGNKYAHATRPYLYWECTQAGTTAGSQPSTGGTWPEYEIGREVTSNTAKFRIRHFHGWARAKTVISTTLLPQDQIPNTGSTIIAPWTLVIASAHSQAPTTEWSFKLTPVWQGSSPVNVYGYLALSVDKDTATPTTFEAGAVLVATGNARGALPTSDVATKTGMVRGVVLGHDNTAVTGTNNVYEWSTRPRYYDCTFKSYRSDSGDDALTEAVHTGGRHSVRCTYESLHATTPSPVLTSGGTAQVEVPTISRAVGATTPVIRANTGIVGVLGADLSSFTGGKAWSGPSTPVTKQGAMFRGFGCEFAASALVQPSVVPVDVAFARMGGTVIGERNPLTHLIGSVFTYNEAGGPVPSAFTFPTVSRENTIVRTGGASDALGSLSRKILMSSFLDYPYTFELWNDKIDESFLVRLHFQWSSSGTGLSTLSKEDVWLEAAYLSNAANYEAELAFSFDTYNRRGLIHNDGVGPDVCESSSETWGGGLGSAVKQSVSVVVTPKRVGPIKFLLGVWMCPYTRNLSSVDTLSIYVDPLPVLEAAP